MVRTILSAAHHFLDEVIRLTFFSFFLAPAHTDTYVRLCKYSRFFHYRPADESEDLGAEWVQGVQGGEGSGSGASAPAPAQVIVLTCCRHSFEGEGKL